MSYDLYVRENEDETPSLDMNITYNVHRMFAEAFPYERADEIGIHVLEGKSVLEALPLVRVAIQHFLDHFDRMVELEPSNGWGTAEQALGWLTRLYVGLKQTERGTVSIC